MPNARKRVLILGGSGFLGRNLIRYWESLIDDKYLSSIATRNHKMVDDGGRNKYLYYKWEFGSNFDCIIKYDPHIIINLIGISHPRSSKGSILAEINYAILPFFDLLLKLSEKSLHTVVFASSSNAIYKDIEFGRKYCLPSDPYTASKISIESFLSSFSFESNVRTVSLRISNSIGVGLLKDNFGVVNVFSRRIIYDEPVVFYGDSDSYKDYIWVDDVSSAIVSSVYSSESLPMKSMIFDVGSGYSISAKAIYAIIKAFHLGSQPDRSYIKASEQLDISSTKMLLKWKPEVGMLDAIWRVYHQMCTSECSR